MLTYEEDTIGELKQAKKEQKQIQEFIEHRSNEIFLLKLRSYLEDEIMKYRGSDIAKLVEDLRATEEQLDSINVQYDDVELPPRFQKLLTELDRRGQINLYLDLIDVLPGFPFKEPLKAYIRLRYGHYET